MANAREHEKGSRIPLGANKYKFQLSERDTKEFERLGLVPRWVNDIGGRINQALAGGYQFASPDMAPSIGESAVCRGGDGPSVDSTVRQVASKEHPIMYAYLMWIQKEFYDEDQEAKQDAINERELDLVRGGGAGIDKTYLPEGTDAAVTFGRP